MGAGGDTIKEVQQPVGRGQSVAPAAEAFDVCAELDGALCAEGDLVANLRVRLMARPIAGTRGEAEPRATRSGTETSRTHFANIDIDIQEPNSGLTSGLDRTGLPDCWVRLVFLLFERGIPMVRKDLLYLSSRIIYAAECFVQQSVGLSPRSPAGTRLDADACSR
jgi:hypothetical protein